MRRLIGTVLGGLGFGLFQTLNDRILFLSIPKARSGAAGYGTGHCTAPRQTTGGISMSIIFATLPLSAALEIRGRHLRRLFVYCRSSQPEPSALRTGSTVQQYRSANAPARWADGGLPAFALKGCEPLTRNLQRPVTSGNYHTNTNFTVASYGRFRISTGKPLIYRQLEP